MSGLPRPDSALSPAARLRSIVSGSIGNLIEWYDWYAYAAFALYFAPAFFPEGDLTAQLLSTAAVFAVGFLVRPLGGWLLGAYADRHGRKAALVLSVLMMCGGSLLIAITPGYASIGVAALSYRYVEGPFLRLSKRFRPVSSATPASGSGGSCN